MKTVNHNFNYQSLELSDVTSIITENVVLEYLDSIPISERIILKNALEPDYKKIQYDAPNLLFVKVIEEVLKIQDFGLFFHYSNKKNENIVWHTKNLIKSVFESQNKGIRCESAKIQKHKIISNNFFLNLLKTSPTNIKYIQLCMLTYPDVRNNTGIRFNVYKNYLKECVDYYICTYLSLRRWLIIDLSQTIISLILLDKD